MKSSLHPAAIAAVLLIVICGVIFMVWRNTEGVNHGSGRLVSDLKIDDSTKRAQNDPEAWRKEVEASIKKDKDSQSK